LNEESSERLFSNVIFDWSEFNRLIDAWGDHRNICFREIEINGQKYTIQVTQITFDGEAPDEMNTRIFVIREEEASG
jgi:hypothetical protein